MIMIIKAEDSFEKNKDKLEPQTQEYHLTQTVLKDINEHFTESCDTLIKSYQRPYFSLYSKENDEKIDNWLKAISILVERSGYNIETSDSENPNTTELGFCENMISIIVKVPNVADVVHNKTEKFTEKCDELLALIKG